ncbi:hypothetical protein GE09DRAFT_456217 [Coniochaeta sp. 2T2.1]|nr:hypothetical protein GE09DRAFT_456217 [Coniochaeta sp. 2T2.1]
MLFQTLLAAAALGSSALALPSPTISERQTSTACLTKPEATSLVGIYQRLIANYTDALAERYCSDDFADYSDSINTFLNQPLGGPTFATKKIFMDAQALNPPFPLIVDSIDAVDCTFITLRWHATFGEAMKPSKGITVLELTKKTGDWQIKLIDTEFNALTWLLDMGGSYIWEGATYTPTGVVQGGAAP